MYKFYIRIVFTAVLFFSAEIHLFSAEFTLKYATMAPQGSLWHKYSEIIKREIMSQSKGRIEVKTYYGGIAGDEKTMAKKLKAGLIDIAAFSGMGLGDVLPSARIFELPMFFSNYDEVDRVVEGLYNQYEQDFKKEGVVLAAWGEGGFVYLMSKHKMNVFMDMKGLKIWAPTGDLIVKTMFQKYGFVPVFLGFESVLTQLQTDGISAVYAPPMAAIGLQWYNEVSYIYDIKLTCSTGATLINQHKFNQLPDDLKKVVIDVMKKYSRELVLSLRKENDRALEVFKKKGIQMIKFPDSDLIEMKKFAVEVQDELSGKLYTKDLLNKARKFRDAR
ncbi:MAG: TRAP transporter substrate-binding protein DctP [Spirochaetia bacterium]|nr:TRAP transporter substrate-binding protein DctP [Spirochaetia bacterium]